MADSDGFSEVDFAQMAEESRKQMLIDADTDPVLLLENVYQLWWRWADFELFIINPSITPIIPPLLIQPEKILDSDEVEFVYTIHDYGHKLTTSKAEAMYTTGMSMCKMFYTIEKMIFLLVERLKSGGIDLETEVQVAFGGHEIAQRKAFESIINLGYNVVVTNFDPGSWGEGYLQTIKRLADRGYGYPPESPREIFRQHHGSMPSRVRI